MQTGTLEQMMDDFKSGVYDYTVNGKCIGCGNCCSNYLPISADEVSLIRKYIKAHGIKEVKHWNFVMRNPANIDMTCPFMDASKKKDKCRIYDVRPWVCREFQCNHFGGGSLPPDNNYRPVVDMRKIFFG